MQTTSCIRSLKQGRTHICFYQSTLAVPAPSRHPAGCQKLLHHQAATATAAAVYGFAALTARQGRTISIKSTNNAAAAAAASSDAALEPTRVAEPINSRRSDSPEVQYWMWHGSGRRQPHRIAYAVHGSGPIPLVLLHGMGACHEHWNKLLPELDPNKYTAYAMDFLGFGDSDKPLPAPEADPLGHLYNYDTWSQQVQDFVDEVVREPAILVGNSAGALAALQAAVEAPSLIRGLLLLSCAMRSMHESNQSPLMHPLIEAFQTLVLSTPLGHMMVKSVLDQPDKLKGILQSAYGDPCCLSPELVHSFTRHLHDPTSCEVLLDVFTNSKGVLPQDLLPRNTVPTVVLWGGADPWEPVDRAEKIFRDLVADFVVLPGVGHFPQDEVPALVAAMLDAFVEECAVELAGETDISNAAAAAVGQCRPGPEGELVEGFTLRGLMAAAELDALEGT